MVCATAPQDLFHCQAKPRRRHARPVEALRRQRHTGKQIAAEVGVSPATVSRILRRLGLNRIRDLEPAEPVRRYERENPGEMIHIDIKKLGRFDQIGHRITGDRTGQSNSRGVGWEFVHVCIDDALPRRLLRDLAGREGGQRRRLPQGGRGLLQKPRRHRHPRHDRQRPLLQGLRLPRRLPRRWASSTSAPSPTRPKPTARPSASSRPRSGNGPTPKPTPHPIAAPRSCPSGCTDTIGIGPMAA